MQARPNPEEQMEAERAVRLATREARQLGVRTEARTRDGDRLVADCYPNGQVDLSWYGSTLL